MNNLRSIKKKHMIKTQHKQTNFSEKCTPSASNDRIFDVF